MACDRKIGPYDCCTVVQGDCLELMKALPDGCVDAVITDPPYGMRWDGRISSGPNSNSWANAKSWSYGKTIIGDDTPFNPSPWIEFPKVILWGCNHFSQRLPIGTTLIWIKRYDDAFGSFLSDAEIAWMKGGHGVYCFRDAGYKTREERVHPTQKPAPLMAWCIQQAGNPDTILDPFLGSGTTAVAAKKLGRHFLGFEISEEYCRIARKRIALVEAQPNLFAPRAEQLELGQ